MRRIGSFSCGHRGALNIRPGGYQCFDHNLCHHPRLDHYLYHAVYGKQSVRRYIALKFAARPETATHYEALGPHNQDASSLHDSYRNSDRPRIQEMVKGLLEWEEKLGQAL